MRQQNYKNNSIFNYLSFNYIISSLFSKQLPTLLLIAFLGLGFSPWLIGSASCESIPTSTRILRMEVALAPLQAQSFELPNGENLNFARAAHVLFYGQVLNSPLFVVTSPAPDPYAPSEEDKASIRWQWDRPFDGHPSPALNRRDFNLLQNYHFQLPLSSNGKPEQHLKPMLQRQNPQTQEEQEDPKADSLYCLVNTPQAVLSGRIISFASTLKGGAQIGYETTTHSNSTPNSESPTTLLTAATEANETEAAVGGQLQFEATKLDLRLRTDDALSHQGIVQGDGVSYKKQIEFNVQIPVGVPLGLNFFYKSAMADIIKSAFDEALRDLGNKYIQMKSLHQNWNEVWQSRIILDPVISDNQTHIAIRGGYRAQIHIGDRFRVTNARYKWQGEACKSPLEYQVVTSDTPSAIVEIVSVGDNVSIARVVQWMSAKSLSAGAIVQVQKLAPELNSQQYSQQSSQKY